MFLCDRLVNAVDVVSFLFLWISSVCWLWLVLMRMEPLYIFGKPILLIGVILILFALCYEEIFDWDASTCCASRMRGNRRRSMRRRWEFARPWPVGVLWVQWGCSGKASSYGTAVWGRAVKAYCRHGRRSNKAVEGIYVLTVRFPLDAYRWRVRDCWNRRPQSLRDDLAWSEFAFEEVCEGN